VPTTQRSKYDPLIDRLAAELSNEASLSFQEVEELLGEALPPAAYAYKAWWANSATDPTHSWARRWVALGWLAQADLDAKRVEFRRRATDAPSAEVRLAAMRPTRRQAVMDLVAEAGIDVSEWAFKQSGVRLENPRANTRFQFNWSFGSPAEGFVVCLWFDSLEVRGDQIVSLNNVNEHRRVLEGFRQQPGIDGHKRRGLGDQIARAREMEYALEEAWRRNQPVRAILNVGDHKGRDEINADAAKSEFRSLDDQPWFVHGRDELVRWELVRGVPAGADDREPPIPDEEDDSPGADDARRVATIRVRRGQPKFRADLIAAYGGKCAVTGTRITELLEAAHIVPHVQGVNYRVSNGMLLRADIHTLYDLHLLSVDEKGRVQLSKQLALSEYRTYHGAPLKVLPSTAAQQPSPIGLKTRHDLFLAAEAVRPDL